MVSVKQRMLLVLSLGVMVLLGGCAESDTALKMEATELEAKIDQLEAEVRSVKENEQSLIDRKKISELEAKQLAIQTELRQFINDYEYKTATYDQFMTQVSNQLSTLEEASKEIAALLDQIEARTPEKIAVPVDAITLPEPDEGFEFAVGTHKEPIGEHVLVYFDKDIPVAIFGDWYCYYTSALGNVLHFKCTITNTGEEEYTDNWFFLRAYDKDGFEIGLAGIHINFANPLYPGQRREYSTNFGVVPNAVDKVVLSIDPDWETKK